MILQTGMRTDIPAFYSEWFLNRIKEGYVLVRNPYNATSVTRYEINPDVIDLIAFCTKNPMPMLDKMDVLKPYGQYWFVTITPYGKDIEKNVPDIAVVMDSFKKLSKIVGVNSIGWRYDPILIDDTYTVQKHIETFSFMAKELSGYTNTCIISFIDLYDKVRRNYPQVKSVLMDDRDFLVKEFVKIGAQYDITIKPCAEGDSYEKFGADCSGCMTIQTFEKALGYRLDAPKKKSAREECACYLTADIGAYNTCMNYCKYCYANYSEETVRNNYKMHDVNSPFLIGGSMPEDKIHQAKQEKWRNNQMNLFDYFENN